MSEEPTGAQPVCEPRRSILRPDTFEQIERLCRAAGCHASLGDSLIADSKLSLPLVESCLLAAAEVCHGRIEAADRLWLLLDGGANTRHSILAEALIDDISGGNPDRPPRFISGAELVLLVFGTVRAARTPEEADAMLSALRSVLDPLLLLEHSGHAFEEAARGQLIPLRALEAALHHGAARVPNSQPVLGGGGAGAGRIRPEIYDWQIVDVNWKWPIRDLFDCAVGAQKWASMVNKLAPPYVIESISNRWACAGETLEIRGKNFGPSGRVQFEGPNAGDPDFPTATDYLGGVTPVSWTDTLIEVVVPAWARSGPLRLLAYHTVIQPCLRLDVYHLGNSIRFRGGRPFIYSFKVNGREDKAWVPPLAPATISWHTTTDARPWSWNIMSGGGTVRLDIVNEDQPGATPWQDSNLPAGLGSLPWVPAAVSVPTQFRLKLTVSGTCGDSVRELPVLVVDRPTLNVEGIEITQGIQVFSLSGSRNTLTTTANKDTIVRVYVSASRALWPNAVMSNVTASLNVDNILFAPINGAPPGSSTGGNPFLTLGHASKIDRRNTNASFNFRIPAALCKGTKTLHVNVWGSDEVGLLKANSSITWTWQYRPALPVRYVRVAYAGTLPTDDQARRTAIRAVEILPYPATDIAPAWLNQWNTSVTNLMTSKGKQTLLDHLHDQHNCTFSEWLFPWEDNCPDDDGARWIGVVNAGIGGKAKTGDNTAVVAAVDFDGDGMSGAHELGHTLCLVHVNQGCNGNNPDESNVCNSLSKNYASLPLGGVITEVPFDVSRNTTVVAAPGQLVYDFMSYACKTWISPTHWNRLNSPV